ncbi:MAG TPA: DUF1646 family protein, partial [Methanotrichaceae archaeon]|nr:DUF1646 family protein [Methanotrichaceae archaeon]
MVMLAGETVTLVDIGLFAIFLIVLTAPFKVKLAEKNLEAFLFVMGALAVTITSKWFVEGALNMELIKTAAEEPVIKGIVPAVLVAGLIFFYGQKPFRAFMDSIVKRTNIGVILFVATFVLGLICSVITAIISALFLCEIANTLPLARKDKINFVVIACFAIGLGAVLTPLGEPLSTIAITKLQGAPYHAGFWYLMDQLGILIILGVLLCSIFAMFYVGKKAEKAEVMQMGEESGGIREVIMRAVKVYVFVAALFLLGAGMEVIIFKYFTKIPDYILFWVNMISAILDNA